MSKRKNIFICADGTWNEPSQVDNGKLVPSNVAKIARIVKTIEDDPKYREDQVIYYDLGVGTKNWFDKYFAGFTGKGLFENIQEAYKYLVENYTPGDRICLFGFSRGAYTARSLAGMISKVGILRKKYLADIGTVFTFYRDGDLVDQGVLDDYRKHFCYGEGETDEGVKYNDRETFFVGVWDTVGALGVPTKFLGRLFRCRYSFHSTGLSKNIKNAFHAVAVDENRWSFPPTLWDMSKLKDGQTGEQRWFSGAHCNVGGGYLDKGLSDRPLKWILKKLEDTLKKDGSILVLDTAYRDNQVKPDYRGESIDPRGPQYFISLLIPRRRWEIPDKNTAVHRVDDSVLCKYDDPECDNIHKLKLTYTILNIFCTIVNFFICIINRLVCIIKGNHKWRISPCTIDKNKYTKTKFKKYKPKKLKRANFTATLDCK